MVTIDFGSFTCDACLHPIPGGCIRFHCCACGHRDLGAWVNNNNSGLGFIYLFILLIVDENFYNNKVFLFCFQCYFLVSEIFNNQKTYYGTRSDDEGFVLCSSCYHTQKERCVSAHVRKSLETVGKMNYEKKTYEKKKKKKKKKKEKLILRGFI
jgi:hypothetical protein